MNIGDLNQKQEIWKDVEGYKGLYKVSNLGKIKSLLRTDALGRIVYEKILRQCLDSKKRYLMVTLCKDGIRKKILVHTLVGKAFVSGYKEGLEIDHKDTVTTNNFSENLKWVTRSENMLNPITRINNSNGQAVRFKNNIGTEKFKNSKSFLGKHHSEDTKKKLREKNLGEKNPMFGKRAPNAKEVLCIDSGIIYRSIREAKEKTGANNIRLCCIGKIKKSGGYKWKYINEVS